MSLTAAPVKAQPVPRIGLPWSPRRPFRTDIEGLRALAVLGVIAFHASVPGVAGGFTGVDVFFVISGYLISGQLLREQRSTGTIRLLAFYARRAKRLLPAACLVLAATAIATLFLEPLLGVYRSAKDLLAAVMYATNWHFIDLGTDYLAHSSADSPVLHFWSLAVEEQFYLVWPLLFLAAGLLSRRRHGKSHDVLVGVLVVVTLASFVAGVYLTASAPKTAYLSTQARAWEFGVGALVAVASDRLERAARLRRVRLSAIALGWLGAVAIVLSFVAFDSSTPFPGVAALVPTLGAAAVIACGAVIGRSTRSVSSVLSLRPVRYVGRVSYAWYLWHWPVLVLVEIKTGILSWPLRLALMGVAFALAVATLHLVEVPISRWTVATQKPSPAFAVGLLCTVLTATLVLTIGSRAALALGSSTSTATRAEIEAAFGGSLSTNSGQVTPTALDAAADQPRPECLFDHEVGRVASCVLGPPGGLPVVLFGDSHAHQWLPAIEKMATDRGWQLTVMAKSGCPVPNITPREDGSRFSEPECLAWRQSAITTITDDIKPSMIIVSSLDNYIPDLGETLTAWNWSLDRLRTAGVPIAYLRDTPIPASDVPACISSALDDWRSCAFTPRNRQEPVIAQTVVGNEDKVSIIDLVPFLCEAEPCPAVRNGLLLYRDDSHITGTAARALADQMNKAFIDAGLIPDVASHQQPVTGAVEPTPEKVSAS